MPANEAFFARRKPAAAFKHGILSSYSTVFAQKAGSVTGGKVVFLDGYAGPGRYDDGTEGSPVLFLRAARRNSQRKILTLFVERDPGRCARLRQVLDEIDPTHAVLRWVREGELSAHLPELLALSEPAALFAFLDPFGTALALPQLRQLLRGRKAPTEVLLHFSVSTIARMGGILRAAQHRPGGLSLADRKTLAHADAFLGGPWWRADFDALPPLRPEHQPPARLTLDELISDPATAEDPTLDEPTLRTATEIALQIAHRFSTGLGSQLRYRTVSMPVRAAPAHLPKYVLVLFTRNRHGVWHFANALGRAGLTYQRALHEHHQQSRADKLARADETSPGLFSAASFAAPPAPFDAEVYERTRSKQWVSTIVANLHQLLTVRDPTGRGLLLAEHIHEVYGGLLGHAWEKHVRAAVRQLHRDGYTDDDGVGDFWLRRISLTAHRRPRPEGPPARPGRDRSTSLGGESAG